MFIGIKRFARLIAALIVGLAFLFPFYISLVTSLDTEAHVFTFPPHLMPDWQWQVYVDTWKMYEWTMYFRNTAFIAVTTIIIALVTSILAAYALSFIEFKGRNLLFSVIPIVLMIPSEAHLIPNFIILSKMHLLDTFAAQILPYGVSVYGIFLLRQFFLTLPKDFWESAQLDGCGHFRFLSSIVLPLCVPILITIALYIFIGSWNSLMWPLMVTQSPEVQPIELALANFLHENSVNWRELSAASIFTTAPVIIVFLLLQKYIISGITRGEGLQG